MVILISDLRFLLRENDNGILFDTYGIFWNSMGRYRSERLLEDPNAQDVLNRFPGNVTQFGYYIDKVDNPEWNKFLRGGEPNLAGFPEWIKPGFCGGKPPTFWPQGEFR